MFWIIQNFDFHDYEEKIFTDRKLPVQDAVSAEVVTKNVIPTGFQLARTPFIANSERVSNESLGDDENTPERIPDKNIFVKSPRVVGTPERATTSATVLKSPQSFNIGM
jgi:hypothetical protein